MTVLFGRTRGLTGKLTNYCPGCTHGIIQRLAGEVLEELELLEKAIGISSIGCSVFAYDYFNCDMLGAAHGRAPAVATGVRRVQPDAVIFTYQGDGDLAAIGTAEIIHAALRGEKITTIFVNNAVFGMTGGQMAPTTLVGQKTTTTPEGRNPEHFGIPVRLCEMLATIPSEAFIERVAVNSPANIRKAKRAIKGAFEFQLTGKGFSLVEILSACPTNWGLSPFAALQWIDEKMIPYFPLQNFRRPQEVK